ncbi:MAG: ABC transporter ATP-binding protein [Pseudomonadota bacterium]
MTRTFPGVVANDAVSLALREGEIHALLGENGAGKSTLVKMIYGVLRPDSGSLVWNGKEVSISSPSTARSLGIAMVFQHFSLFDALTVFENIYLGLDKNTNAENLKKEISAISERYGLPLDPDRHVYTLSVGERQRIEIIRCLLQNPKLLVMDEPTSVLTPQEVEKLFQTLRQLADEGMAILYISHKLDEIKQLCEHATILRDGRVVDSVEVVNETAASLAEKMMGQALSPSLDSIAPQREKLMLLVNELNADTDDQYGIRLRGINLQAYAGEIVGIAGVAGNGQEELLKAVSGETLLATSSMVKLNAVECGKYGPNRRRKLGLACIPEERLGHGSVPGMSLKDNALLTSFKRLGLLTRGFIRSAAAVDFTHRIIERFDVRYRDHQSLASSLSGGNLQKFIVGREMAQNPDVLVVSQPTWGVDAGAAQTIRASIQTLAGEGSAVVVISQDLDELMSICHRIGAICAGRLSDFYPVGDITVQQVGLLMAGAESLEGDGS